MQTSFVVSAFPNARSSGTHPSLVSIDVGGEQYAFCSHIDQTEIMAAFKLIWAARKE